MFSEYSLDYLLVGLYHPSMSNQSTRDLILDSAQSLAQARGFNAFSYADIAVELGVRKASIHYHFPSKQDLEAELLERYRLQFVSALGSIEQSTDGSVERLERYADLYAGTLKNSRICLAGMMASDIGALPVQLAPALSLFFDEQINWLAKVLGKGKSNGELSFSDSAKSQASALLAALQGGLLIANATGDNALFSRMCKTVISKLQ